MANTQIPVQPYSWLDKLDEEFDDCVTVANGGYETGRSDTITITNPGAVTGGVSLNSGGTGWAYPNVATNGYSYTAGTGISQNPWATQSSMATSGKLTLLGEDADLVINGKSLTETIARLEQRLNILTPNPKLEADWEELKQLGDRYRELEKHINAKMKTFETLKRYDEPN